MGKSDYDRKKEEYRRKILNSIKIEGVKWWFDCDEFVDDDNIVIHYLERINKGYFECFFCDKNYTTIPDTFTESNIIVDYNDLEEKYYALYICDGCNDRMDKET